jgi:SAM-dependent methyltransferase
MQCIVCDGDRFEDDGEGGGASYVICVGCGLQVMHPRIHGTEFYREDFWGDDQKGGFERRLARSVKKAGYHAATIRRHVQAGAILDIGCGYGHLGMRLREAGLSVDGVEPGRQAAEIAEKNGILIVADTVEELLASAPPRLYDCVSFASSLINLEDPMAALRGVRALLKPQGVLYVQVNNPIFRSGRSIYHPFIFHPSCLGFALGKCGYQIVEGDFEGPGTSQPVKWWLVYVARPGGVASQSLAFDLAAFRAARADGNARLAAHYKSNKRELAKHYALI